MHNKPLKFGIDQILSPTFGSPCVPSVSPMAGCSMAPTSPMSSASSSMSGASPSSVSPTFSMMNQKPDNRAIFPAWVFCTRYSDRPSSGSRTRKNRKRDSTGSSNSEDEKRPRTAFTSDQLDRLKQQFHDNRYLTEKRRQELAHELGLNESQIKIWFQNKRAKLKKSTGDRSSSMSYQMMAQLATAQSSSTI